MCISVIHALRCACWVSNWEECGEFLIVASRRSKPAATHPLPVDQWPESLKYLLEAGE